jgi:hypothetical protein
VLNCTTLEEHGGGNIISEEPIEDGSRLADHIIEAPRYLRIEGVISPYADNPVDQAVSSFGIITDTLQTKKFRSASDYAADVWARIRALAASRDVFDVTTDREYYKSMVFESYSCSDANNAGTTFLSATLRQVQFASTKSEPFADPAVADTVDKPDNVGSQPMEAIAS